MKAQEIKEMQPAEPAKNKRPENDLRFWISEIAHQLAVMNEREAEILQARRDAYPK